MRKVTRSAASLVVMCVLGAAFASAPAPALAGGGGTVSGPISVHCTGSDYATINAAMGVAPMDHATITVCGGWGYYNEAVNISGRSNFKLVGKNNPVIIPPYADFSGPMVYVLGSTNVTLSGFIIDGFSRFAAAGEMTGVEWTNSSGSITKNTIRRIRRTTLGTDGNGVALLVDNMDPIMLPVTVKGNTFVDYQLAGVKVSNNVKLSVSNNLVRGWSKSGARPAGIWLVAVRDGATISKNTIAHDFGPENMAATTGIILDETSHARVTSNKISASRIGIFLHDGISGVPDASANTISGNTLTDTYDGIYLYSDNADAHVDGNKVTSNKLFNSIGADRGIYLWSNPGSIQGTVVTGNQIFGDWGIAIFQSGDTGTIGVNPQKNKIGVVVPPGA